MSPPATIRAVTPVAVRLVLSCNLACDSVAAAQLRSPLASLKFPFGLGIGCCPERPAGVISYGAAWHYICLHLCWHCVFQRLGLRNGFLTSKTNKGQSFSSDHRTSPLRQTIIAQP
jgi:hypothetical protein